MQYQLDMEATAAAGTESGQVAEMTQKWIAEQKENLLTSEMTLRSALQFLDVPGEVIRKADEMLSEIPNRK